MNFSSMTKQVLCVAALFAGAQSVQAQSVEHIFIGGSRYVYDIHRGESVEESILRLPNKMIVPKAMLPRMAQIYRTCARDAKFRGKVQAFAGVYSSHFSAVTLRRNPNMSDAKFNQSVSCVKAIVDRSARL